jgi:nicotinamide mononucleotide adenylyltransferase
MTGDSVNDQNRSTKAANPLTYFERYEMIKGAMQEFKVPEQEYDILPFPINFPEYIANYMPEDATYFMGLSDAWDEEKYKILRSLKLDVEVLWRREEKDRGVSASWVRSCIAMDEEWAHLVPKSVYKYLTETHLVDRIKHLEKIRIEEKMVL